MLVSTIHQHESARGKHVIFCFTWIQSVFQEKPVSTRISFTLLQFLPSFFSLFTTFKYLLFILCLQIIIAVYRGLCHLHQEQKTDIFLFFFFMKWNKYKRFLKNICLVHIYHGCYWDIKKNEIMPFVATRMGPDYYAQSEKYHMYCLYVESEKLVQMNLLTKQKQSHRRRKQTYGYQGGMWGRDKLRSGLTYTHHCTQTR